ncbi:MAG TPA: hypothetical protein VL625_01815 [Patescibacteria group bacterium]|nr:hypothetical protein [Patescibacteria group bacterium]
MTNYQGEITSLVESYFNLCGKLKMERDFASRMEIIDWQRKIEEQVFSRKAQTVAELDGKARVLLHLIEDKDSPYHTWNSKELYFTNVLHDIVSLNLHPKLSPDLCATGVTTGEAATNHYQWMFGGWPQA